MVRVAPRAASKEALNDGGKGRPAKRKYMLITGPEAAFPVILDPVKRAKEVTEVEILYPQQTYETQPHRFQWDDIIVYSICSISIAVDVSNVIVFPYLLMQYGGAAFLIPYFIMLIFAVVPCFYMECIIGQYTREGTVSAWKICPAFKGIGWCMLLITFLSMCYSMAFLSWSLVYIWDAIAGWKEPMTSLWHSCSEDWSTANCRNPRDMRDFSLPNSSGVYSGQEYFRGRVLEQRLDHGLKDYTVKDFGEYVERHLINNAICYFVVGLLVTLGVQHAIRMAWLCCIAGIAGLMVVCFRGVTLPGSEDGLQHFFKPNFTKLLEIQTWQEATRFSFHSPGVGYGMHLTFSSYNRFGRNILPTVLVTVVVDFVMSILAALAMFSYIGFLAMRYGQTVSNVVEIVPEMLFETMVDVLGDLPTANFFIFILFASIFFMGINHKINCFLNITTGIIDEFTFLFQKYKYLRIGLAILLTIVSYLCSILMTKRGSIFWVTLYENRYGVPQMIVILLQVVVIGWVFGIQGMCDCVEAMTGSPPNIFFRVCWKITCPFGVLMVLISQATVLKLPVSWRGIVGEDHGVLFSLLLVAIPIVVVPLFALILVFKARKTKDHKLRRLLLISPEHEHEQILESKTGFRSNYKHFFSFGGAPMTIYIDEIDDEDGFELEEGCALPTGVLAGIKVEASCNPDIQKLYMESLKKKSEPKVVEETPTPPPPPPNPAPVLEIPAPPPPAPKEPEAPPIRSNMAKLTIRMANKAGDTVGAVRPELNPIVKKEPEKEPEKKLEKYPEKQPEKKLEKQPEKQAEKQPEKKLEKQPEKKLEKQPEKQPEKKLEKQPEKTDDLKTVPSTTPLSDEPPVTQKRKVSFRKGKPGQDNTKGSENADKK